MIHDYFRLNLDVRSYYFLSSFQKVKICNFWTCGSSRFLFYKIVCPIFYGKLFSDLISWHHNLIMTKPYVLIPPPMEIHALSKESNRTGLACFRLVLWLNQKNNFVVQYDELFVPICNPWFIVNFLYKRKM